MLADEEQIKRLKSEVQELRLTLRTTILSREATQGRVKVLEAALEGVKIDPNVATKAEERAAEIVRLEKTLLSSREALSHAIGAREASDKQVATLLATEATLKASLTQALTSWKAEKDSWPATQERLELTEHALKQVKAQRDALKQSPLIPAALQEEVESLRDDARQGIEVLRKASETQLAHVKQIKQLTAELALLRESNEAKDLETKRLWLEVDDLKRQLVKATPVLADGPALQPAVKPPKTPKVPLVEAKVVTPTPEPKEPPTVIVEGPIAVMELSEPLMPRVPTAVAVPAPDVVVPKAPFVPVKGMRLQRSKGLSTEIIVIEKVLPGGAYALVRVEGRGFSSLQLSSEVLATYLLLPA